MTHRVGNTVYGTKSGAMMLQGGRSAMEALSSPADYAAPLPGFEEQLHDVAMWGTNNLQPQEMAADMDNTGVLNSGIDGKARITVGKGPTPCRVKALDENGYETLEFITNSPALSYLKNNRGFEYSFALANDLIGYGNGFVQILLSRDRNTIVGHKRMDTAKCRLSKVDPMTGKSEFVYISADWQRWYMKDTTKPDPNNPHIDKIPLLDKDFPLADLQSRSSGYTFAMCVQYPLSNRNYYASAPWYSARKWVSIAQGIPELKAAMFKNQITLKYIVEIHPKFWEKKYPEYADADVNKKRSLQDTFYKEIDELLVGGPNAYKSLFSTMVDQMTTNGVQSISAIKVIPVEDKTGGGSQMNPDSAAANSEILFALMINPALMGADSPGGPYSGGAGSGSNIREALLVQVMLTELERRMISQPLDLITAYNGWGDDLVYRYPQQILTTLNQGANTQATA